MESNEGFVHLFEVGIGRTIRNSWIRGSGCPGRYEANYIDGYELVEVMPTLSIRNRSIRTDRYHVIDRFELDRFEACVYQRVRTRQGVMDTNSMDSK